MRCGHTHSGGRLRPAGTCATSSDVALKINQALETAADLRFGFSTFINPLSTEKKCLKQERDPRTRASHLCIYLFCSSFPLQLSAWCVSVRQQRRRHDAAAAAAAAAAG